MANNTGANNNYYAAILLPTYCEAENIENLIHNIENLEIKTKIIVIDDSSPDGTGKMRAHIRLLCQSCESHRFRR
jgi:cellulose synthase/poly-beta-1,6-N-acetylglucosamine synthase-like glycosyltransferase